MKNFLLTMILITHTNNLMSHKLFVCPTLTQNELESLRILNDNYLENKLFLKKMSNDDLTLNLDLLSKQIQLLNKEPFSERSLMLILCGFIPLSAGIYCTINPIQGLYKLYNKFIVGKFKDMHLPFYLIKKLPSTTISQEEKQYLQRFSCGNIHFTYEKDPFIHEWYWDPQTGKMIDITQKDMVNDTIARLSPMEEEKIRYLALREVIGKLKFKAFGKVFAILFGIAIGITSSFPFFKEAFASELKTKTKLYKLLKKEHQKRC